ncbi:hypothetical protein D3Y57_04715 (plasmid) [Sphingomonas paeninsulae]|uniref:Uncharacterized protein n=1 Tax=Sphingomonas paeninsulae TaxID=2319844 RepID=A0A494TDF8_SPHPE|nr:hypothetical protein [Sphingomonas paeninsulae]AYJ85322.1 hypothetical protein D3Y57_04715 [Sphingomonas paeninsulae]
MTDLSILQHSLGVDQFGQGNQYRNRYCAGPGCDGWDNLVDMVERGLMTRRDDGPWGGDSMFYVTDAGRAYVAEQSPAPPKLTRSQQRYRRYLDADSHHTFREWLASPFANLNYVA